MSARHKFFNIAKSGLTHARSEFSVIDNTSSKIFPGNLFSRCSHLLLLPCVAKNAGEVIQVEKAKYVLQSCEK